MRWLSFTKDGDESFGVVVGAEDAPGVVDVGVRHPEFVDLKHVLAEGLLDDLGAEVGGQSADHGC